MARVKAEKQMAAARAHGKTEEEINRQVLKSEAAINGFSKAAEKAGILGEDAGNKTARGMKETADAAEKAASKIHSVEDRLKALHELQNPNTSFERKKELLNQGYSDQWTMDTFMASVAQDEAAAEAARSKGLGFSYQVPDWESMSADMRERIKKAVRLGNQPGMQDAAKEQERKLYRQMKASLSGLERMKERLKKAGGSELDEETGRMLEGYVAGARKNLSEQALSELKGAVDSWKSRRNETKMETPREQSRTAPSETGVQPAEGAEKTVIQTEKPVEIRTEGRAEQPIAVGGGTPTHPPRQTQPQIQPVEGWEQPPSLLEGRREGKPDDRPLKALDEISSILSRIDQGIQDLIRISSGGAGSSRTSLSATDLTRTVLRSIQEAGMCT